MSGDHPREVSLDATHLEEGPLGAPLRVKPLLRGVSHELAAVAALPLVASLVAGAPGRQARCAALVYGVSVVALFALSALYHRPTWPARIRALLGRADHAAIFLLIAGTYTPLCLRLGGGTGRWLLALVWVGAALGVLLALGWDDAPKALRAAVYIALGWLFVPAVPAIHAALGAGHLALLLAGGALYTVGAVIFARRSPDPWPTRFGYHEVFHLLVVLAALCHYLVVAHALAGLA
jgi:hemolysin III